MNCTHTQDGVLILLIHHAFAGALQKTISIVRASCDPTELPPTSSAHNTHTHAHTFITAPHTTHSTHTHRWFSALCDAGVYCDLRKAPSHRPTWWWFSEPALVTTRRHISTAHIARVRHARKQAGAVEKAATSPDAAAYE